MAKLIQRFPNAIRENPSGGGMAALPSSAFKDRRDWKTKWKFPSSWLLPLDHVAQQGVTWIELMLAFEIATRVMSTGVKVTRRGKERENGSKIGKGDDTVAQRS